MLSDADVEKVWDENAPRWISQVRRGLDTLREDLNNPAFFETFLDDLTGKRVIDLGCGEGRNTRLLARRGARMTGIDLSSRMIEAAQLLEAEEPLGIVYQKCSFTALTAFADSSFDAAISTMAFMDSPGMDRVLQEVFRVLRTGGALYFSVVHPCFWTHGSRWILDENGRSVGILTADYWIGDSYTETVQFVPVPESETDAPISIPHFPYRLESYVNGLARAGFQIMRILEPRPNKDSADECLPLLGRITKHAPVSVFFAAKKL